jgi:alanyl-tRNA synthetase
MTSAEIRQSFLDFFQEKQHTIVPSALLLPQSPGLLFTNAGMNPFVPYFLGVEKAPYAPPRAADTQKCIRAGGKHNDLEDVGYDTYHHTFFEMLGNWSFGDYFKKEAIAWAWELVVERWGLPAHRLYASVYAPKPGDPGHFDQEAYDLWAALFISKGCDPAVQIVHGNVKDNFWMMGETGPCGPCSELHVDLTPEGNPVTGRNLVNNDSDLCIEIWNLVFIQYNAEADGSFRELPAKHVDTGMGFERACSIIQNTKGFTDFSEKPSNYATDVFQPIFRKLEALSGKTYSDIYPELGADRSLFTEEMKTAIAFRVIADHLRTLSFSIADGIMPGNNGRNYVLRRILRRAVSYGRQLGFSKEQPFFGALVETLVNEMGDVFSELKQRQDVIRQTLDLEEANFNETLDKGLQIFELGRGGYTTAIEEALGAGYQVRGESGFIQLLGSQPMPDLVKTKRFTISKDGQPIADFSQEEFYKGAWKTLSTQQATLSGDFAFLLYSTFGFPIDLTELKCLERGLLVDRPRFEQLMEEDRELSRAAQKSSIIRALDISTEVVTEFVGFEQDTVEATILEIHPQEDALFVITDRTVFYAEMGGQAGDTGTLGGDIEITGTQQIGRARAHVVSSAAAFNVGDKLVLCLDEKRRRPIEAHHTATHLLHWALHEVVSPDAAQQGSSVDENRLRFDFNSAAVTPVQLAAMEEKVNAAIHANDLVSWKEVPHASIKGRADIMQFFGDKYGDLVRVVQIGGQPNQLDGYSQELCGGTHVRNTGEIGLFKIKSEGAIASGVRRIEAVCGEAAHAWVAHLAAVEMEESIAAREKLDAANQRLSDLNAEVVTLAASARSGEIKEAAIEAEKRLKKIQAAAAASLADESLAELIALGKPIIVSFESDASLLQELQNGLKKKQFAGPALLIVDDGEKLHLATHCGPEALAKGLKAGDLLRDLVALAGGKGGGKPDQARGAAPDRSKLEEIKAAAAESMQ